MHLGIKTPAVSTRRASGIPGDESAPAPGPVLPVPVRKKPRREVLPVPGAEDVAFRTSFYEQVRVQAEQATRIQRWAMHRLSVKATLRAYERDMIAARFIQAIWRGFTTKRRVRALMQLRLWACCRIQAMFRKEQGRRRALALIERWRTRHQTRAIAAFREALVLTAQTSLRITSANGVHQRRRYIRAWHELFRSENTGSIAMSLQAFLRTHRQMTASIDRMVEQGILKKNEEPQDEPAGAKLN